MIAPPSRDQPWFEYHQKSHSALVHCRGDGNLFEVNVEVRVQGH